MDGAAAQEELLKGLGFPLNFSLHVALMKIPGVPIADSVIFLDGVCRGRLTYNAFTKIPSFDPQWPPTAKAGEQQRLFSTARVDEFEARVSAITKHFTFARTADPSVLVITAPNKSVDDATDGVAANNETHVAYRVVSRDDVGDVIRGVTLGKATCLICEYRTPSCGRHHLLRCLHTPYTTVTEIRYATALLSDQRLPLASRIQLDAAGPLPPPPPRSSHGDGALGGVSSRRSSFGDLRAESLETSSNRPSSAGGHHRPASASSRTSQEDFSDRIKLQLDAALQSISNPKFVAQLGGRNVERCVLYCMTPTPKTLVILWCSQFHCLTSQLDQLQKDRMHFEREAAERQRVASPIGATAAAEGGMKGPSTDGSAASAPAKALQRLRTPTPLPEQQSMGEYIDLITSIKAFGTYGNVQQPLPPSLKKVTDLCLVTSPVAAESLPAFELPAVWHQPDFFTKPQSEAAILAAAPVRPSKAPLNRSNRKGHGTRRSASPKRVLSPSTSRVDTVDSTDEQSASVAAILAWDVALTEQPLALLPKHQLGHIRQLRDHYGGTSATKTLLADISEEQQRADDWIKLRRAALSAASRSVKARLAKERQQSERRQRPESVQALSRSDAHETPSLRGSPLLRSSATTPSVSRDSRPKWNESFTEPIVSFAATLHDAGHPKPHVEKHQPRSEAAIDEALLAGTTFVPDYAAYLMCAKPVSGYLIGALIDNGAATDSERHVPPPSTTWTPNALQALETEVKATRAEYLKRGAANALREAVRKHGAPPRGEHDRLMASQLLRRSTKHDQWAVETFHNTHPSLSQRQMEASARLEPELLRGRDFAELLFTVETDGSRLLHQQRRAELQRIAEMESAREAAVAGAEMESKHFAEALESRRRSVKDIDDRERERIHDKFRAKVILEEVNAVVDLVEDLVYNAKERAKIDKLGSTPTTAPTLVSSLAPTSVGLASSENGAPDPSPPLVVSIPLGCALSVQREAAALLAGAGFFATPIDAARRDQWNRYHLALGYPPEIEPTGAMSDSENEPGNSATTSPGQRSSVSPALNSVSHRMLGSSVRRKSLATHLAVSQHWSSKSDAGENGSSNPLPADTGVEFRLRSDPVTVARALGIFTQYRQEIVDMTGSSANNTSKLSKVQQLVVQMGYSHFDAVAAAVKGLSTRASAVHASLSFAAMQQVLRQGADDSKGTARSNGSATGSIIAVEARRSH